MEKLCPSTDQLWPMSAELGRNAPIVTPASLPEAPTRPDAAGIQPLPAMRVSRKHVPLAREECSDMCQYLGGKLATASVSHKLRRGTTV